MIFILRLNEKSYNEPTQSYKSSYFYNVVNSFKEKAIRVRLTKIKAGTGIPPHIDYDPSYATRVIVPIVSSKEVVNQFWVKNSLQEYNLPADGSAYFLNVGFRHAVINRSQQDRTCLMFSLDGQGDLLEL